jgi:short subunit dehydrogenase-like uncharacterized protein
MTTTADILLLGATGYAGRFVAKYLVNHPDHVSSPPRFTVAFAGRSTDRLNKLLTELDLQGKNVNLVQVDTDDYAQVEAGVRNARVVINAVGPFLRYSKHVPKACAAHGIHYVDLAGEAPFMKYIIDECEASARNTGAILIPASGLDSVPADLSTFIANQTLKEKYPNLSVRKSVSAFDADLIFSGGSLATVHDTVTEKRPEIKAATKPFALSPIKGPTQPTISLAYELPVGNRKLTGGFYVMSATDKLVVQRTWGLHKRAAEAASPESAEEARKYTYDDEFTYDEFLVKSNKFQSYYHSLSFITMVIMLLIPPSRWLLTRLWNQPGQGASEAELKKHHFTLTNVSTSNTDANTTEPVTVRTTIHGDGDVAYILSAEMTTESALALLFDKDSLPPLSRGGGVFTPASGLGNVLVRRLDRTGSWKFESVIQ